MSSIGIRASANEIYYAIFEGSVEEPIYIHHYKLSFPKAFEPPAALAWAREQFINVTKEFQVDSVFIRTTEPIARVNNRSLSERSRIEGVGG